jgi:hypothetical protein
VYVIAKGKDHKQYEYGNKVSIVSTKDTNIIVGVASHDKNMRVLDKNTVSIYHLSILATYMKQPYQHIAILFPTTDDQGNASIEVV